MNSFPKERLTFQEFRLAGLFQQNKHCDDIYNWIQLVCGGQVHDLLSTENIVT